MLRNGQVSNGYLRFNGRLISNVKLVVATRGILEQNSQSKIILVEDGTDEGKIKIYSADEQKNLLSSSLYSNRYVEIFGRFIALEQVSDQEGSKFDIIASRMTPLGDGNQLTRHYLEVAYSHKMYIQRQSKAESPDTKLNALELKVLNCIQSKGEL